MLFSIYLIFFFTSLLASSFMMLLLPNPIHSLLSLVLVFLSASSILITFNVEFIALLLIIIYVGAIAVLFLFVLMMMDIKIKSSLKTDWSVFFIFGLFLSGSLFLITYNNLFDFYMYPTSYEHLELNQFSDFLVNFNNCLVFGHILYSYYLFFFLMAGLILLLALLGAVHLTHTPNKVNDKYVYSSKR